jgi:hypothetical protein
LYTSPDNFRVIKSRRIIVVDGQHPWKEMGNACKKFVRQPDVKTDTSEAQAVRG